MWTKSLQHKTRTSFCPFSRSTRVSWTTWPKSNTMKHTTTPRSYTPFFKENLSSLSYGPSVPQLTPWTAKRSKHKSSKSSQVTLKLTTMTRRKFLTLKETLFLTTTSRLRRTSRLGRVMSGCCGLIILMPMRRFLRIFYPNKLLSRPMTR